jgi:hypothetical protein
VHHEHRAHDLASARRYAQALRARATGRARDDAEHRLGRLERKMLARAPVPGARALDWDTDS